MQRIRLTLASDAAGTPTVGVSAGVAVERAPQHMATLLRAADAKLYAAKHAGRNRTVSADAPGPRPVDEHGSASGAFAA